ncbi:MAG: DEAD/DEAH box helicase [Candidatus Thermoplasmatota archaeon]|nr:DEAD/DEAH box helicase [Candidatus Thermoplasmatota archaeon]
MKCEQLIIHPILLEKLHKLEFRELTLIQEKSIPAIVQGNDVVGQAETGSGKTLAFCLPILNKIIPGKGLQALVLTPTRELCVQVTDVFRDFGKNLGIRTTSVYGGVSIGPQIHDIRLSEIVIGTPGRLLDHLRRRTIELGTIKILVLDETDKMFEMGFVDDVEEIIRYIPQQRQLLMFSATISEEVHRLARKHLKHPVIIKTQSYVDHTKLKQIYYDIYEQNQKFSLLVHLLKKNIDGLSIVFCGTRRESDAVSKNLARQGIRASAIHGGMKQQKRSNSLDALKTQKTKVLVATDVAARGLDIKNVTYIYNYDVPKTPTEYVHRIGRTARAGANGAAITLLTERDHDNFRRVQSNDDFMIERADIPEFRKVPFMRRFEPRNHSYRGSPRYSFGR